MGDRINLAGKDVIVNTIKEMKGKGKIDILGLRNTMKESQTQEAVAGVTASMSKIGARINGSSVFDLDVYAYNPKNSYSSNYAADYYVNIGYVSGNGIALPVVLPNKYATFQPRTKGTWAIAVRKANALDEALSVYVVFPSPDANNAMQWVDDDGNTFNPDANGGTWIIGSFLCDSTDGITGNGITGVYVQTEGITPMEFLKTRLMQIMNDISGTDTTDFKNWAIAMGCDHVFKRVAVMEFFVNSLFANAIKIQTGGHIRGGDRYNASGTLVDWTKTGFWFGSDGKLKGSLQSDPNYNTYVGTNVGAANTNDPGECNTAIGYDCLYSAGSGCSYNVAVGYRAMKFDTSGDYNVAIGMDAMYSNDGGRYNVGIGFETLMNNTTGLSNVAIGTASMKRNTLGAMNVAIGYDALFYNVSGERNVAIGYQAMVNNSGNGHENVAIGVYALQSNTSGGSNVAIGSGSLGINTTGSFNIGIGAGSGGAITTGQSNLAIGYNSAVYRGTGYNQMNIMGSLIYLEFDSTRKYKEIYNVLTSNDHFYFVTTGSIGAMGFAGGQAVTGLNRTSSGIQILGPSGSIIATLTASSNTTFSSRTVLFFTTQQRSDTAFDGEDCLTA